jgi:hypothetical protein
MKVGIFVTNQNPLGADMVSAPGEQFAMTRLARDRGWDSGRSSRVHRLARRHLARELRFRREAGYGEVEFDAFKVPKGQRDRRTASSARTGLACRWPTLWPACGS